MRRSPSMIATDGSAGVEASLKICKPRFVLQTKSVNVPPVSTPTRTRRDPPLFGFAIRDDIDTKLQNKARWR
jgi:hypothetical protein